MDDFDRAQELEARQRESDLMAHAKTAAAAVRLIPTGACLNPACDLPFDEPGGVLRRLFCNPKCGAEHARRTKATHHQQGNDE